MTIDTVLFDADGVLQRPTVRWREAFARILGTSEPGFLEPVLNDILAAESGALCVSAGFEEELHRVLAKWCKPECLPAALEALNAIDVNKDVLRVVRSLISSGVQCHIASNQQAARARHMSEALNYRSLFTREFYSCFVGKAKPDMEFFERILGELAHPPGAMLFLDDRPENVEVAERAGLAAAVFDVDSGVHNLNRILADHGLSHQGI